MEKKIIDAFGYVLKEENFEQLNSKIIPKTLVVEDLHPFPGYHGTNLPESNSAPGHIYFITKKNYNWEDITNVSHKIKKYIDFPFMYYDSTIKGDTKKYNAIRIKGLKTYDQVEKLQKAYEAEGIKFASGKKFPKLGFTKLKKFFILNQWSENVYHDQEVENFYYITVKETISWEFFRQVTLLTRSNLNNINFDAAQAVIYYRNEMLNTVRIYSNNLKVEDLETLRNKYLELIKRYS